MSGALGWVIDIAYVIVGCVVAWRVLPIAYRSSAEGGSAEPWIDRWAALFAALIAGTFWPAAGLIWLVDWGIRARVR
jgi:hypothetical protein